MSIFNPTIPDTTAVGSTVLQLSCSDADPGINGAMVFLLSMNYGVLGINDTGAICIRSSLDSIRYSVLKLTVLVSDRGSPPLSNSYPIIIFFTFTVHIPPVFTYLLSSQTCQPLSISAIAHKLVLYCSLLWQSIQTE